MKTLQKEFNTREDLISYVRELSPWANGEASNIIGSRAVALECLAKTNLIRYSSSRNYANGDVTRLSSYIHHGVISLNEVRNHAISKCEDINKIYKFIQELGWRDFWQLIIRENPTYAWQDVEHYKTGLDATNYLSIMPNDIINGTTPNICINQFIQELLVKGYIHNHARMYLASYIIHFRRVKWQVGAKWFLEHLLDGDIASNNLSWQWVASTFSNKPYIFNLENVDKYFNGYVNTSPNDNPELNFGYEIISNKIFPGIDNL